MLDFDHGARSEAHEVRRRPLQPDAHWESLRNAHPIQRAFDIGNGTGNVDAVLIDDAPAYALDRAFDRDFAIEHRKNRSAIADGYRTQIGFAKIGDGEPFVGIDQG